jgi:hypothetical protein
MGRRTQTLSNGIVFGRKEISDGLGLKCPRLSSRPPIHPGQIVTYYDENWTPAFLSDQKQRPTYQNWSSIPGQETAKLPTSGWYVITLLLPSEETRGYSTGDYIKKKLGDSYSVVPLGLGIVVFKLCMVLKENPFGDEPLVVAHYVNEWPYVATFDWIRKEGDTIISERGYCIEEGCNIAEGCYLAGYKAINAPST